MHKRIKVQAATAHELIKNIRLLAMCGKVPFRKYLYNPLLEAGWRTDQPPMDRRRQMEKINRDFENPAFLHTIGQRCRKIIAYSMEESLAALGESSIFFLEKMQMHPDVSSCIEAIEFAEIVTPPLTEFSKANSEKSEALFSETVFNAGTEELKLAFEPDMQANSPEKIKFDGEIRRLYENILIASQYENIQKCRKLLASYIIRYSDDAEYARSDVEKLIGAMNNRAPGFEDELKNTIAIDLYYRITQGVLNKDINSAITGIRKYGYIFEGDTTSRYFFDIDRFERILYKIISEKGLWNELKNRRK